jgi:phage-related protein
LSVEKKKKNSVAINKYEKVLVKANDQTRNPAFAPPIQSLVCQVLSSFLWIIYVPDETHSLLVIHNLDKKDQNTLLTLFVCA